LAKTEDALRIKMRPLIHGLIQREEKIEMFKKTLLKAKCSQSEMLRT